ncbi:MAG TPA: ATP-binding cassette domain-containing protein, partial [Acetobacteraceae bacterium]|nr:ATP-binding cassette domain-containing protein [Acetobacteraceae bacterium]
MPAEHAVVELTQLRHTFGGNIALHDISTTIQPGMITGLVGPDASGKTTLLRLIAGLLHPAAGGVRVLGFDMARESAAVHPFIGYMPQRFGLYEDLSVAENLDLFADLHTMPLALRTERIARLLRFTGLAPFTARLAGKLSGGMKQKLGLACALLARPRLLLLDEPSVGVDPASRRELWAIVNAMLEKGRTEEMAVVWATAYLDEAERCGRVLLLHQGRLLSDAPPAEFLSPLHGRVFRMTVPAGQRRAIARYAAAHAAVLDAQVTGDALRIVLRAGAAVPAAPALGGTALDPVAPRFEDGFIARLAETPAAESGNGQQTPPPPLVGGGRGEGSCELPPCSSGTFDPSPHPPPARGGGGVSAPASGTSEPPIIVHDLVRRFGAFTAVDHISFSVQRGEIFGLLGP